MPKELSSLPVWGISRNDLERFLQWRNEKAREKKEEWVYSLPTQEEWNRMGGRADGRNFPYGDKYFQNWSNNPFSKPYWAAAPSYSFPKDESPYGVFDLLGNVSEWSGDPVDSTANGCNLFGGSFFSPGPLNLFAKWGPYPVEEPSCFIGLRLVARKF